jgi:hypothetical protein
MCMKDCVLTCRTKLFAVEKGTILCNSEHNNFVVHSKTIIRSNISLATQLTLAILALP